MREDALFSLVKSTLADGFGARQVIPVSVVRAYQPRAVGMRKGMTVYMSHIGSVRVGSLKRKDTPILPKPVAEFTHTEQQWWETTLQINGAHERNPENAQEMALPSAYDIAKTASDILQGDKGLSLLAVQRVRPLRITQVRNVPFMNDSNQWEMMPSFDIVLSYPDSYETTTPAATLEQVVKRV